MDEGYSSADKDFKEWSLIDFPNWLNFNGNNGAVITGDSSSTTIGSHEVKLSVTNAWGASTSENFYITVNGKYAPELADLGVKSVFNGSNFSLQIDATDADPGDELTFEAINLPTWLEMSSSGLLSGIPGEEDIGTHSVTILVSDFSGLTDQKSYVIDVQSIFGGSAPVINDYEIPNATEDLFYSFQIGASDADPGDQITFSGINLPEWLVISDSGLLSGDPDKSDVGQHNFTIQVSDLSGSTNEKSFNISVKNVNDAPTFDDISLAKQNALFDVGSFPTSQTGEQDGLGGQLIQDNNYFGGNIVNVLKYVQSYDPENPSTYTNITTKDVPVSDDGLTAAFALFEDPKIQIRKLLPTSQRRADHGVYTCLVVPSPHFGELVTVYDVSEIGGSLSAPSFPGDQPMVNIALLNNGNIGINLSKLMIMEASNN